jgi:putative transposase
MASGHVYLTAIIDWFSRKILAWKLSTTLDTAFCIDVVNEAIDKFGTPEIVNTDQGCQYTSKNFTNNLLDRDIQLSMDSKGRALDNIMIERFWGSLKREKIYINEYDSIKNLYSGIEEYVEFYNNRRPHQSLNDCYPSEVFKQGHSKPLWKEQLKVAA